MIVHSYYYGPVGNGGLSLETTDKLTSIVNEELLRDLYSLESSRKRVVSKIYETPFGPVIGITIIKPAQSHDKRVTIINKTYFVKLSEIVSDLTTLLDKTVELPLKQTSYKIVKA